MSKSKDMTMVERNKKEHNFATTTITKTTARNQYIIIKSDKKEVKSGPFGMMKLYKKL